jgi:hypothetical protein
MSPMRPPAWLCPGGAEALAVCRLPAPSLMKVDQKNQPDDWQRFRAESLLGAGLGERKNTPRRNRCCLRAIRECLRARTASPPLIATTWTWRIDGSCGFTRLGASRRRLPSGKRNETKRKKDVIAYTGCCIDDRIGRYARPAQREADRSSAHLVNFPARTRTAELVEFLNANRSVQDPLRRICH